MFAGHPRRPTDRHPVRARDLFYVEVADGKLTRLENEHPIKGRFTPSPDGNEVAYEIAAEYGTLEIWKTGLERREH